MRKKIEVKSGDKYGRLTIISEVEPHVSISGEVKRKFECICDCGIKKNIVLQDLRKGSVSSCGCYVKERLIKLNTTHGFSKNLLYPTWKEMIQRCYNTSHKQYNDWGGRGIKVCDRWLNSPENFIQDMGNRPKGTSLDRINNDGNYEPNNCRWATSKEQSNNRRPKEKKL